MTHESIEQREGLTRPIIGIENRTAQEVFDIMCDRFRHQSTTSLQEERDALAKRVAELEQDVIAFCAPTAVQMAAAYGLPEGHLHPTHYDILAKASARMDDFTRAALNTDPSHAE